VASNILSLNVGMRISLLIFRGTKNDGPCGLCPAV